MIKMFTKKRFKKRLSGGERLRKRLSEQTLLMRQKKKRNL